MNPAEDIKNLIDNTIGQVFNLKCFIESVVNNLGEPNDSEKIQEIKKKADNAEKEIEENILRLAKLPIKKQFYTARKIAIVNEERAPKKLKKTAIIFDACFRHHLHLYRISGTYPMKTELEFKKILEEMKGNICRRKSIKGIEHFEYHKDEKKNAFRLKIKFLLGIELIIFSDDGSIRNYLFSLSQESINLKQLISMLEVKFEYDIDTRDRNMRKCVLLAAD